MFIRDLAEIIKMKLIEDKEKITEAYIAAINMNNIELFGIINNNCEKIRNVYPIIEFIIERLESVVHLTTVERIWDAEIVLRSALETFIKFLFIASTDKKEQEQRLKEFWEDLAEVNSIKQSEQAKKNLQHLGQNEIHMLAYSPVVLSEEDEKLLRDKWNKRNRQQLEQKWSFSSIIASLSQSNKGKPFDMLPTLAHSYRMSSHVTHGDETGILIISERNSRTQEKQNIANFAHYLRLISDGYHYCAWTAITTMDFLELNPAFFFDLQKSFDDIHELVQEYQAKLFDDTDYDKLRNKK
ncbi:MAG: DUF5677 domain-containing protein [Adhaeribacter sp.]